MIATVVASRITASSPGQSVGLALEESGDDSFVVVAAVENGVHECDCEDAAPGSAEDDPEQELHQDADDEQGDEGCGE